MTTPASVWRNAYITSRLPHSSGTTGQICSAPFVLHKDMSSATGGSGANADRPFEVANGLLTDASHANIVPIGVPAEYAILETWMVILGTHDFDTNDTAPIINIYGKTSFGQQHDGNMPDDYATITDWPANLREWWMPLPMTDRTTAANTASTGQIVFTGINPADLDAANGSGSHAQHAFEFKPQTIPVPATNAGSTGNHSHVARIGDGTGAAAFCFPSQTFFLNGSDTVMATVKTAFVNADSDHGTCILMGRFHG